MKNVIKCETMEEYVSLIAGLVKEGLTFDGYATDLTITLTGGY